jgi:hypothetical protein
MKIQNSSPKHSLAEQRQNGGKCSASHSGHFIPDKSDHKERNSAPEVSKTHITY